MKNWLRPDICRGEQTLPQNGIPSRPPLLSPQTDTYIIIRVKTLIKQQITIYYNFTFPSFETINNDFEPPTI